MKNFSFKKFPFSFCLLIFFLLTIILIYLFIPEVHLGVNQIIKMFGSGNFSAMQNFVASYGIYAGVISFLLMIFQAVLAPIPSFVITIINANLFGRWQGALLSWISSLVGALLCFYIARILGRTVVERIISKTGLRQIDNFFEKYGRLSILIARLLPFISFDLVSYAAGLTSISPVEFLLATAIGELPATIIYSYVGSMITGGMKKFIFALLVLIALAIFVILLKKLFSKGKKVK